MRGLNQIQHVVSEDELSTNQRRYDYGSRTDGQPVYMGVAERGDLTSTETWLIRKYTYDENDFVTLEQTAVLSSWDNRASATYA